MNTNIRKPILFLAVLSLAVLLIAPPNAHADFQVPVDTLKIGLYYNSGGSTLKNFTSANLQNFNGCGYGYELGYFDENREFVSVGATIEDTNKITMFIDKNMYYSADTRSYLEGTEGDVTVGCFHIQLSTVYDDFQSARQDADTFNSVNGFVKYSEGSFFVCAGDFQSADEAAAVAEALDIQQDYSITSGTAYTVCVAETGTDRLLFEFEYSNKYSLAVRPLCEDGIKPKTHYRGNVYYGDFAYVRAYRGNITVVNYVNIEDYVKGVLPYEMSSSWPLEALKAQAVCARSYAITNLNKHRSLGFDICNTVDCQVYSGTTSSGPNSDRAANETEGQYLTYDGKICETYFYSSNGGASESCENVWSSAKPYLVGVIDPYEADVVSKIALYNWSVSFTGAQLAAKLQANGYKCSDIKKFEILQYSETGNVIKIKFTDADGKTFTFSKDKCRTILGVRSLRYTISGQAESNQDAGVFINSAADLFSGLLSDLYAIGSSGISALAGNETYAITGGGSIEMLSGSETVTATGNTFVINGSGWGHNVGMSQWGAYSMAKVHELSYEDILYFYFQGSELVYSEANH